MLIKNRKYVPLKNVEFVVQDCTILGKKVITHYIEVAKVNENRPNEIR